MDSRGPAGRRAGERNWVCTEIPKDTSSFPPEVSVEAFVEAGVPHFIAMMVGKPVTGEKYFIPVYSIFSEHHCMLL